MAAPLLHSVLQGRPRGQRRLGGIGLKGPAHKVVAGAGEAAIRQRTVLRSDGIPACLHGSGLPVRAVPAGEVAVVGDGVAGRCPEGMEGHDLALLDLLSAGEVVQPVCKGPGRKGDFILPCPARKFVARTLVFAFLQRICAAVIGKDGILHGHVVVPLIVVIARIIGHIEADRPGLLEDGPVFRNGALRQPPGPVITFFQSGSRVQSGVFHQLQQLPVQLILVQLAQILALLHTDLLQ